MNEPSDLEALAQALEASDDYRVLRRLRPRQAEPTPDGAPVRSGLYLDLETTGTDPVHDEIIEIADLPGLNPEGRKASAG